MPTVNARDENGQPKGLNIDRLPDECPLCHKKITPNYGESFIDTKKSDKSLKTVFLCPNARCRQIFIGYYSGSWPGTFSFQLSRPQDAVAKDFGDIISEVSPDFVTIYNQASAAEQMELTIICGAGYRKAFEFLIKDYVMTKQSDTTKKEEIKKEFLGSVIEKYVTHQQLKNVAKRAAWLGNDESHYERKWIDKDINDLKDLIDLTIRWIEADKLTERLEKDMPERKNSKAVT